MMLYKTCRQHISTQTIDRGGHTGINKSYALFSLASKPWHPQDASTRVSQPQQGPRSGLFGYQRLNGCRLSIFRTKAASYESVHESKGRGVENGKGDIYAGEKNSGKDEIDVGGSHALNVACNDEATDSLPMRKTKMVATIGPASCSRQMLFALADQGMNIVRLNMSHGTHESHSEIIKLVREYNALGRNNLAIMLDTKGAEVRSGDVHTQLELKSGDCFTFTIREGEDGSKGALSVNYDDFVSDVAVGDVILIDGGIMSMKVTSISGTDVHTQVLDGGTLKSRRHLNIRGKSANLPAITDKDWEDIKFGLQMKVDYVALSFVRDAESIIELKQWLDTEESNICILAKIESADSVLNLDSILDAADGAMVARGDLGAELPIEEVPFWQFEIIKGCRQRKKPVIVATNMLESMIELPVPTRAEVADIAIAVKEGTDAIMLSGETAYGKFPLKAVDVMSTVARRTELGMESATQQSWSQMFYSHSPDIMYSDLHNRYYQENYSGSASCRMPIQDVTSKELSEIMAQNAVNTANTMQAPIVVFTRKGRMPTLLSHFRPQHQIFCFADNEIVQRRLCLFRGVTSFLTTFCDSAEATFDRALQDLKEKGFIRGGQLVVLVQSGAKPIWKSSSLHSIQIRETPID